MDGFMKRGCCSLQLSCQIEILKNLHAKAAAMEAEYIDQWCIRELTTSNQNYERGLDIRTDEVSTCDVVQDFVAKYPTSTYTAAADWTSKKKKSRFGFTSGDPTRKKVGRPAKQTKPNFTHGIPNGVPAKDYILYKKCRYVEDIQEVRKMLMTHLNTATMNGLMTTLYNMSLYNTKQEHGLLTLQAMLTTKLINDIRLASAKLYINFSREVGMETSMATTILHYTLNEGTSLVQLNLDRCGCDSLLQVVSKTAKNLKILKISGSHVSDQGLLYLCGAVKSEGSKRSRLPRACKRDSDGSPPPTATPKYATVDNAGCLKLEHLEATNLQSIIWNAGSKVPGFRCYQEYQTVPMDSGFVAMLMFMPKLKVFITEVGARAVHSYHRMMKKHRRTNPALSIEILTENHLTPQLMASLQTLCPKLREVRVLWHNLIPIMSVCREDWVPHLSTFSSINAIRVKDVDFKSDKFSNMVEKIGKNLSVLDLKDICFLRHANIRAIKLHCPNLRELTLTMLTKNIFSSSARIEVDKDASLDLFPDTNFKLSKLERVHISGPFGNALTKYLLRGAEGIKSLALGIEWLDPAFCSTQPEGRSDYLGKEYLDEILTVNSLSEVEEVHFYAQLRRARLRLNRACAEFVLSKFTKLKHLGNFSFWSLSRSEKSEIIAKSRSTNRDILFDEDLFTSQLAQMEESSQFEYKFIEGREHFACNHINLKKDTGLFTEFWEVLAGPPELFADVDVDSGSSSEDDEDDDWSDDNDDNDNPVVGDIEPVCAIM